MCLIVHRRGNDPDRPDQGGNGRAGTHEGVPDIHDEPDEPEADLCAECEPKTQSSYGSTFDGGNPESRRFARA